MHKIIATLFFLSLWPASESNAGDHSRQLEMELARDAGGYAMSVTNISKRTIALPDIALGIPEEIGYWLFLYDPATGDLQHAWHTVLRLPGKKSILPTVMLPPGGSISQSFTSDEILSYFNLPEGCFYLVALYRKRNQDGLVASMPSNAILECTGE